MNAMDTTLRLRGNATARRAVPVTRGLLAAAGVLTFLAVLAPEPREHLLQYAGGLLPQPQATGAGPEGAGSTGDASSAAESQFLAVEQRAIAEFIARRYRVGERAASAFVSTAYRVGHDTRVDPLLILAVAAIESSYNPIAESFLGAKGLMQVIPKYHPEKLIEHGGEEALLDPMVNIQVGAKILREYLRRFGTTETALQVYGGAHDEPTLQYANKVLAERAKLQQTARRAGS